MYIGYANVIAPSMNAQNQLVGDFQLFMCTFYGQSNYEQLMKNIVVRQIEFCPLADYPNAGCWFLLVLHSRLFYAIDWSESRMLIGRRMFRYKGCKLNFTLYFTSYKLNDEHAHVLLKRLVSMEVKKGKKQMLCSICFIVFWLLLWLFLLHSVPLKFV